MIQFLEDIRIKCCVMPPGFGSPVQTEIHRFSDASESGIGQVSYLRMVNAKNQVHVSFLMVKSRVAPLKAVSIPRLELTAAFVSVNVTTMLKNELDYDNLQSVYYIDSEAVISYIHYDASRFHIYVGNRVQHIHDSGITSQAKTIPPTRHPAPSQQINCPTTEDGSIDEISFGNRHTVAERKSDKSADVEVRANTFVTTASSQSQRESSPKFKVRYLDRFSSWCKAKATGRLD